jgi:hypothetical protein
MVIYAAVPAGSLKLFVPGFGHARVGFKKQTSFQNVFKFLRKINI